MSTFILHHPYAAMIGTWLVNNVVTAMISSLPAPTATSAPSYVYWFKVLNTVAGNFKRAQSTAIENSPNWQAAVDKHMAEQNGNAKP